MSRERRFLRWRSARKKEKLTRPIKGKKFRKSDLPPISRDVFARISEIWGIPLEELVPYYIGNKFSGARLGTVERSTHEVALLSSRMRESLRHELVHSAIDLLQPKVILPFPEDAPGLLAYHLPGEFLESLAEPEHLESVNNRIKKYGSRDLLTKDTIGVLREITNGVRYLYRRFPRTQTAARLMAAILLWKALRLSKGEDKIRIGYFKKHGVDGIILLAVEPPRELDYDLDRIQEYEKKMLKAGYLSEKGGLTENGIAFVKKTMPRERIIQYRAQQEATRRSNKP